MKAEVQKGRNAAVDAAKLRSAAALAEFGTQQKSTMVRA
jgi:hypothetical protein